MPENSYWMDFVDELNEHCHDYSAMEIVNWAVTGELFSKIAFTTSFGASSVVLLHLLSLADRNTPVIFLDTKMHFSETLEYQKTLTGKLGLTNVRTCSPSACQIDKNDPEETLNLSNPDACCNFRKTEILARALRDFNTCVTGRSRYQTKFRADLQLFEYDNEFQVLKINPLAYWSKETFQVYIEENNLPFHPLAEKGYLSIGCAPCTSKINSEEHPRSGRWRGLEKTECGLHASSTKKNEKLETSFLVITDSGFKIHDDSVDFIDVSADIIPQELFKLLNNPTVRINFASFSDGRGFTLARLFRLKGFKGILRAKGDLLPDQYSMLRRSGFDELEIDPVVVERHSKAAWLAGINWQDYHYQKRLGSSFDLAHS